MTNLELVDHGSPANRSTDVGDGRVHSANETRLRPDAPTSFADHSGSDLHSSCVGDGSGQSANDTHAFRAASDPIDPATHAAHPTFVAPGQALAVQCPKPKASRARAKPIDAADIYTPSDGKTPHRPPDRIATASQGSDVGGHTQPHDQTNVQLPPSVVTSDQPDGQLRTEVQSSPAVGLLIELWRQRQDLRRAEGRLNLQCQAICRRVVGGDKEAAGKLWAQIRAGKAEDADALLMVLSPYTAAMSSLAESAANLEKQVVKLVRPMPLWIGWGADVRGMAELSFAGMIGEAARMPGDYRSVAALWKRFGLAVIDGGRQRLIAGAENALIHGYSPQRRAYAYTLSTNLMRSQRDGEPYRALYDRRKAYELEREIPKGHAHNRALRVMVKALLRDAWVADHRQRAAT